MADPHLENQFDLYKLSTDYELLFTLIKKGFRVPAWVVYSNDYDESIWDIVEVKFMFWMKGEGTPPYWQIGSRGVGYGSRNSDFESFEKSCKSIKLKFIEP